MALAQLHRQMIVTLGYPSFEQPLVRTLYLILVV
jgi:hypothetical protein